jgi:hypothetical protein
MLNSGLSEEELTKVIFKKEMKNSIPKEYEEEMAERHIQARKLLKHTLFQRNKKDQVINSYKFCKEYFG